MHGKLDKQQKASFFENLMQGLQLWLQRRKMPKCLLTEYLLGNKQCQNDEDLIKFYADFLFKYEITKIPPKGDGLDLMMHEDEVNSFKQSLNEFEYHLYQYDIESHNENSAYYLGKIAELRGKLALSNNQTEVSDILEEISDFEMELEFIEMESEDIEVEIIQKLELHKKHHIVNYIIERFSIDLECFFYQKMIHNY